MRIGFRLLPLGFWCVASCTVVSCTAVTDATSTQCRSQTDCWARGRAFADTTCSADRICVPITTEGGACKTNQECIERNGGANVICEKSEARCVSVTTPDCPTLLADKEDLANDEVLIVGHMASAIATAALAEAAFDLARFESKRVLGGGLPPSHEGGQKRPIVVLSCVAEPTASGLGSVAAVDRVVNHWAKTLKIPMFIGPLTTPQVLHVFSQTIPFGLAALTQNSNQAITDLADNDLVFRIGPSEPTLLKVVNPVITQFLDAKIRAENSLADTDEIRLALVTETGQTLVKTAGTVLSFNGKTALENGSNFLVVDMGNTTDPVNSPNPETQTAKGLAALKTFAPHVIVWITAPTLATRAWAPLMRAWPAAVPRPYSITSLPTWQDTIVPAISSLPAPIQDASRSHYLGMNGTSPTFSAQDFQGFVDALRLRKPEFLNQPVSTVAGLFYDAFYLHLYAMAAVGAEPISGRAFARGLRRVADVSGGVQVRWGTDDISKGLAALTAGKNLSYVGATGDYRFDEKGDRVMNSELFCVQNDAGKLKVNRSGFVLDQATNTTTNTLNCP